MSYLNGYLRGEYLRVTAAHGVAGPDAVGCERRSFAVIRGSASEPPPRALRRRRAQPRAVLEQDLDGDHDDGRDDGLKVVLANVGVGLEEGLQS